MKRYPLKNFEDLELLVNDVLGLKGTKGSGNVCGNGDGMGQAKDLETQIQLLVECKYTEKEPSSIILKKSDWDKTEKAAYRYSRIPVMVKGDISGEAHVVMSLDDFKYLYSLAKGKT